MTFQDFFSDNINVSDFPKASSLIVFDIINPAIKYIKQLLEAVMIADPRVLKTPRPQV